MDSPLNAYIPYNNIKSLDSRTKITITHPQNMLRPVVNIDTSGINTSTTIPEFKSPKETIDIKYYESNHTVNADISNKIQNEIDKKQNKNETIFIWKSSIGASGKYNGGGYLSMSNKQITSLGIPTSPLDATTKEYVDDKVNIKQDKLIAGENIKIDEKTNTISAIGGSSESLWKIDVNSPNIIEPKEKRLITANNTRIVYIADPTQPQDAVNKRYVDNKIQPILTIPKWKEVGTKININHIKYNFKVNTKYKIYYNFESQTSIKKFAFICKEFLYGELNTDVQTLDWDKVNDRMILSLQMQNDTIAIVSDPTRFGQLLKLEELQE